MQAGGGEMYFDYGEAELQYLRSRDKRMGEVIDRVGMIRREVDPDLFAAVVHHIVGQQISTKAQATVWRRMQEALGTVDAGSVLAAGPEGLQALGISGRKAAYITDFALRVQRGAFDPETVRESSDAEAIRQLCTLKGVGVWTAEMILLFCLQRPDIFSYDDLAIQRGLRMVYHHRQVGREPMAAWPVSICGRWPEVLCRSCGTMRRRERKGRSDMTAWQSYASPVGELLLAADEEGLTGLWLAGEKYFPGVPEDAPQETPVLEETKRWLDIYFAGREPDFLPPLHLAGSPFRQEVWALLRQIPYGETTTYRALAEAVARKRGLRRMSAQAVGGAVGHNPISIIVPCHRVVGSDGSLTGYAGGLERKVQLLRLEGVDMSRLYVPKKGTAL